MSCLVGSWAVGNSRGTGCDSRGAGGEDSRGSHIRRRVPAGEELVGSTEARVVTSVDSKLVPRVLRLRTRWHCWRQGLRAR